MLINALFDPSASYAPTGYAAAVASAIQYLDNLISTDVTLNVHFGWGESDGRPVAGNTIGQNVSYGLFYGYPQIRAALAAHATSSSDAAAINGLPMSDPTNGGTFFVPEAQAVTLGLESNSYIEGWVGLNADVSYTFDAANRAVYGAYDAIGVLEHELTELMGRVGYLKDYFSSTYSSVYGLMDLFRYSSPGLRDFTGNGYFSVDGQTLSTKFNDPRLGGDVADWDPGVKGDAFGNAYIGTKGEITPVDVTVMDIIGYRINGVSAATAAISGTSADDIFVSTPANESYDGLGGIDTVVYHGTRAEYTVGLNLRALVVTDSIANRDGTDTLLHVEQLKFADINLAFDLQSSQDKLVYELYQAAFGRIPDTPGFRYWADLADRSNASAQALADAFIGSREFALKYGNPDIQTYVSELYLNVLGRSPDQAGLDYWTHRAENGEARDQLLIDFATSGENQDRIAPHVNNGYWLT